MPLNGAGSFVRLYNWVTDKANGIKIIAQRVDDEMNGMAQGISTAIMRDGQSTVTAPIPFNNQRITGLADPTADQDAVNRQYADGRYSKIGSPSSILLDNANFRINTRAVSGTVTLAAGAYGHDRWKAGAAGCSYTFAPSGADVVITIVSGSLMQAIEAAQIDGGSYTLSHTGTAQARIAQGAGGAFAASPVTLAGLTANSLTTVEFSTGTVSRARFEAGTVASQYVRRNVQQEIVICQRYARRVGRAMKGFAVGTMTVEFSFEFAPPMRAGPAISILNASVTCTRAGIGNSTIPIGSVVDAAASPQGARWYGNLSGGAINQGEFMTSLTDDVFLCTAEL